MTNPKKPSLYVVSGQEEWDGLYIDGVLVMEDHSLNADHVLELLAERGLFTYGGETLNDVRDQRLMDGGRLPPTLEELEKW